MSAEDYLPADLFEDEDLELYDDDYARYMCDDWKRFYALGNAFPDANRDLRILREQVLDLLSDLGAYLYYSASTGSQYIKFGDRRLGSLRIADHRGIEKYRYRWNIGPRLHREDRPDRGAMRHYYHTSDLSQFYTDLRAFAQEVNKPKLSWHGPLDLNSLLP